MSHQNFISVQSPMIKPVHSVKNELKRSIILLQVYHYCCLLQTQVSKDFFLFNLSLQLYTEAPNNKNVYLKPVKYVACL